jgi:hypothetical protein
MSTVGPMHIYIFVSSAVELNRSLLLDVQVMDVLGFFNKWYSLEQFKEQ